MPPRRSALAWARGSSAEVAAAARRRVFARVGGPSTRRIANTAFYLDGHLLKRDRRAPFTVFVPKRFAKPDGSLLEALTTLSDSRRQTVTRHIVGCRF